MKRLVAGDDDVFESSDPSIGTVWQASQTALAHNTGELKSLELEGSSSGRQLSICFRNHTPNTILYCWVSHTGHLRGFRPIQPSEIVSGPVVHGEHMEQSYLGHAFVFVELPEDDEEEGKYVDKKKKEWWRASVENLDKFNVIGAYRPICLRPAASKKQDEKNNYNPKEEEEEEEAKIEDNESNSDSGSDSDDEDTDYLYCHVISIQTRKPSILDCCCLPESSSSSSSSSTSHLRKRPHTESSSSSPTAASASSASRLRGSTKSDNLFTVSACVQRIAQTCLIDTCQTKRYTQCKMANEHEWPVCVEEGWLSSSMKNGGDGSSNMKNGGDEDEELHHIINDDLTFALSCIPSHAREQLRASQTMFWINKTFAYGPESNPIKLRNLCFHPSVKWLVRHKMHQDKAGCVELYNIAQYVNVDRKLWGPGGIFIHEMSHAYHYKCLPGGYRNQEIQACYEAAMKEGLYDCVEFHCAKEHGGGDRERSKARAYACDNCMEYWAELSTAFLGGTSSWRKQTKQEEYNKWYPFNRLQIKQHDPRAYELLQRLWKVQDDDDDDE